MRRIEQKNKNVYADDVIDNFFRYLKKLEIKQKTYADDNLLDKSILSKWKKGISRPNLDQIKQAAKYFDITVNDLVYSDKEKKQLEVEVLKDKSYDPILAQQSIWVNMLGENFYKPIKLIIALFVSYVFVGFLTYFMMTISVYFALLIVAIIPILAKKNIGSSFYEKNFIINYLDDIYYRRESEKNRFYYLSVIVRLLSLLCIFYYVYLIRSFSSYDMITQGLYIALLVLVVLILTIYLVSMIDLPRKFKIDIYDDEFYAYGSSKLFLIIHFSLVTTAVLFCLNNIGSYLVFLIFSIVTLSLNILDFMILSKEYSKYKLVFQENNNTPRELFSKKN